MKEEILSVEKLDEDEFEASIRPQYLKDYVGQEEVKKNLNIFIKAAKMREEALDHVLLYGPPGLGKTTLSYILANEMGTKVKVTSGPSIERPGDLAAILSSLEEGDVLFIDEIHRLPRVVEEILYPAMEDYCIDIVVGKDSEAHSIRLDLPPFTLVGATTRIGSISSPLRDRFGITFKLDYYSTEDLEKIVNRTSSVFGTPAQKEAINEIARRSRGTPRITNRLFRRVRDYAQVLNDGIIDLKTTKQALKNLNVDEDGLDSIDIKYLMGIIERYHGGPVGLDALASSIGEEKETLEDVHEPYLIQKGYVNRTPRGREVTSKAYEHLKISNNNTLF